MKAHIATIAVVLWLTACGSRQAAGPTAAGEQPGRGSVSGDVADPQDASTWQSASSPASPQAPAPAAARALAGRAGELVNPDNDALVLLYYDLAGLAPPIDDWVEKDTRVRFARPADKDAQRAAVRAELAAAAAAVRGIGILRLSLDAKLSDYDPTYGEFTVRAFAPSSVVTFDAFGQSVSVKFGNARDAQLWQVGADEARAIRDRISYGSVTLDALLAISGVQPAPQGGAIVADVIEYEMRDSLRGQLIGRVEVASR